MKILGRPAFESDLSYLGGPDGIELNFPDPRGSVSLPSVVDGRRVFSPPESGLNAEKPHSGIVLVSPILGYRHVTDVGVGYDYLLTDSHFHLPVMADAGVGFDSIRDTVRMAVMFDSAVGVDEIVDTARFLAFDRGLGVDHALRRVRADVFDAGVGVDDAVWFAARQELFDYAVGDDEAYWEHVHQPPLHESAVGSDRDVDTARFRVGDRAFGVDPLPGLGLYLSDSASGRSVCAAEAARQSVFDAARGFDVAPLSRFTPHSASAVIQVTDTDPNKISIPIPVWARYIDVVMLGGGASGRNGSLAGSGDGGNPGLYAVKQFDRGASRNAWKTLVFLIGKGGSGNNVAGAATELWIDDNAGWSGEYLKADGGSGTGSNKDAAGPGNRMFQGINAVGGTGNGSAPGSGGRGGSGGFGDSNSDPGARGQAWVQFSM